MSDATLSGRTSPRRRVLRPIRKWKSGRALLVALLLAGLMAAPAGAQSSDFEELDSGPQKQTGTERVEIDCRRLLPT